MHQLQQHGRLAITSHLGIYLEFLTNLKDFFNQTFSAIFKFALVHKIHLLNIRKQKLGAQKIEIHQATTVR
jgi:hypothetical protein